MKCVFIEASDIEYKEEESIDDLLNVYINEDLSTLTSNVEPKLNYAESLQYFDNLQKELIEYQELLSTCDLKKEEQTRKCIKEDEENQGIEEDRNLLFNTEKKKFIEAFSSIGSWPMFNTKNTKANLYSMDADIQKIYSNFSSLTQFLQAKEEISNANIPKEISKINTSLNEIVGDAVTATEETLNVINSY